MLVIRKYLEEKFFLEAIKRSLRQCMLVWYSEHYFFIFFISTTKSGYLNQMCFVIAGAHLKACFTSFATNPNLLVAIQD